MTTLDVGPARLDLTRVRAGDYTTVQVSIKEDDSPKDTTGAVVSSHVRKTADADAIAITGIIGTIDETQGVYTVSFDGADVRTLLGGRDTWDGVWDIQIILDGTTYPVTLTSGTFSAEMDVTRP